MADRAVTENEAQLSGEETESVERLESAEDLGVEEPSEVEELRGQLEQSRSEAEEYLDGWRRTQAEFANYKKRQRAEQGKARELANATLLRKLLPVLDDFERAISTMPDGIGKLSWTQGLLMVRRELEVVLESEGVVPIETVGVTFDPHYHEAVTHEELAGYEGGQIIGEVQRGYTLGDRVLRPALVRVAKTPSASPGEEQVGEEQSDSRKKAEE